VKSKIIKKNHKTTTDNTQKTNATTATDRAPQMTLVEKFAKQRPADSTFLKVISELQVFWTKD